MIARRERANALADLDHDACALVPEHHGEEPLGVLTRKCVGVRVTYARGGELDQALARARPVELDLLDFQRASGFPCNCRFHLHGRDYTGFLTAL